MKIRIADGTIVDPDTKWTVWEEIALEDELGLTMAMLSQMSRRGSARSALALVWLTKRRSDPDLRARDLDFSTQEIEYLADDGETPLVPKIDDKGQAVMDHGVNVMLLPDGTVYVPKGQEPAPVKSDAIDGSSLPISAPPPESSTD